MLRRPHTTAAGLATELKQALDRPVELWGPSFEHGLSDLARELLLTLVTFPPAGVARTELLAACALQAPSLPTNQAFRALERNVGATVRFGTKMTAAFADPSCRDYVLAYLDAYPDEAMRLLLGTGTMDQAVLLLRYAASTVPHGRRTVPAHPGIKAAASESTSAVLQHLDRLYAQAVAAAEDYGPLERLLTGVLSAGAAARPRRGRLDRGADRRAQRPATRLRRSGRRRAREACALRGPASSGMLGEEHRAARPVGEGGRQPWARAPTRSDDRERVRRLQDSR